MGKVKRLAKEGSWIVFGQAATIAASLFLVRELTTSLTPFEYGQLALGLTIAGLIDQVMMGGIINGATRFYSIAAQKKDLNSYFSAVKRLFAISSLAILLLGVVTALLLTVFNKSHLILLIVVTLIFSITSAINGLASGIQNAARQRALVAFHGCIDAWLKIGMALIFINIFGPISYAVVMGYVLSGLFTVGSQLFFLKDVIPRGLLSKLTEDHWARKIRDYARPFALWGILGWAQQSSTRWALEFLTTTENVGLYSVLNQLSYAPIVIFTSMAMTLLMPIFFERYGDGSNQSKIQEVKLLTRAIVITGLIVTAISFISTFYLHSYIFNIFVGKSFSSVSFLMPYLVLAGGIFAVAQIYASQIMAMLMPEKITAASIGSSVVGVVSSFVGVYFFSVAGAVFAMVLHSMAYLLFIFLTIKLIDKTNNNA